MQLNELSLQRQKTLFETVAAQVLPQWQIGEYKIAWVSYSTNAVFAVEAATGRYILRLHTPGRVSEKALRSELIWLRVIRQRTDLIAPMPVSASDGQWFAAFSPPSIGKLHCVLFERIAGESKSASALTAEDLRKIGACLGELHRAAQFDPPADFERHHLDFDGLFGIASPYYVADECALLTPEQSEIFRAVMQRLRHAMTQPDPAGDRFGLIHADLLAKNLIFADDKVAALDFEYCGWGYFLYDLAPLLWQLKGDRASDYPELEAALWQGYLSVRPEAEKERASLEDFIAARQLLSCRWLLQNLHLPNVRAMAPALLQARADELKDYLSAGLLLRRSATL